jgi:hypothetical protein
MANGPIARTIDAPVVRAEAAPPPPRRRAPSWLPHVILIAGVAIFALVSLAAHLALRGWHESELSVER